MAFQLIFLTNLQRKIMTEHIKGIRHTLLATVAAICLLALGSCRQAEDNIGNWAGAWTIEKIEINGEKDPAYLGNLMVNFQGKMFDIGFVDGLDIMGLWSRTDTELTLNPVKGSGISIDAGGGVFFPFPEEMHIARGVESATFTFTGPSGGRMTWQRIDEQGATITYHLRHIL